jgi:hypothetical protein
MCGANKRFLLYLLFALLLSCVAGALRGEEREAWYLISETELRSIETYLTKSEAGKRAWLLRVQELKARADSLRADSESLNGQLARAGELNRMLQKLFNEYEAESLTTISMKNGEIAGLKQEVTACRGIARGRLIIIIALGAAWIVFIAFKIRRFFRVF